MLHVCVIWMLMITIVNISSIMNLVLPCFIVISDILDFSSLPRWTPFFGFGWRQNKRKLSIGMIAWPVKTYLLNVTFEHWIDVIYASISKTKKDMSIVILYISKRSFRKLQIPLIPNQIDKFDWLFYTYVRTLYGTLTENMFNIMNLMNLTWNGCNFLVN